MHALNPAANLPFVSGKRVHAARQSSARDAMIEEMHWTSLPEHVCVDDWPAFCTRFSPRRTLCRWLTCCMHPSSPHRTVDSLHARGLYRLVHVKRRNCLRHESRSQYLAKELIGIILTPVTSGRG